METKILLQLYAVKNNEGKYFRAKGINGLGKSWVEDISKAKIYPKIGQARARATWYTTNYPQFGTPLIVVLNVQSEEILDETERVKKSINKKKLKEAKILENNKKRAYDKALDDLNKAKKKLDDLAF